MRRLRSWRASALWAGGGERQRPKLPTVPTSRWAPLWSCQIRPRGERFAPNATCCMRRLRSWRASALWAGGGERQRPKLPTVPTSRWAPLWSCGRERKTEDDERTCQGRAFAGSISAGAVGQPGWRQTRRAAQGAACLGRYRRRLGAGCTPAGSAGCAVGGRPIGRHFAAPVMAGAERPAHDDRSAPDPQSCRFADRAWRCDRCRS